MRRECHGIKLRNSLRNDIIPRRVRASRELKSLKLNDFLKNSNSESEALRQLVTEIERLTSLARDED